MKVWRIWLVVSSIVLALAGCSDDKVDAQTQQQPAPEQRLSIVSGAGNGTAVVAAKTIAWHPDYQWIALNDAEQNQQALQRLHQAIATTLSAKGYQWVEDYQSADVQVGLLFGHAASIDEQALMDVLGMAPGLADGDVDEAQYQKATLAIAFINPVEQKSFFKVVAQGFAGTKPPADDSQLLQTLAMVLDAAPVAAVE